MMTHQKISKKNVEDIFSLSPLQEGILYHYMENSGGVQYNEQLWITLKGHICEKLMEKAWDHVVKGNEMLRAVFMWEKLERPVQIVLKDSNFHIEKYDLSGPEYEDPDITAELEKVRAYIRNSSIDISKSTFKVALIKLSHNKYEMVIINHHIIYDGWSNAILIGEFLSAYKRFLKGETVDRAPKNGFKNFIKWVSQLDKNKQQLFWQKYMEGFTEKTSIPVDTIRDKSNNDSGVFCCSISEKEYDSIKIFCSNNRFTASTLFNAVWAILLQRYSGSEDVVFGTTVSGRNIEIEGIERMVGLFINTIPLRVNHTKNESIMEFIQGIEKSVREREEYEHTSLADIKSYCAISGNDSIFDSIVVIENYPKDIELNDSALDLSVSNYTSYENTNYPLTVMLEFSSKIKLSIIYKSKSFKERTIIQLANHFINVLSYFLTNPNKAVTEVELTDDMEKHMLLHDFNDTYAYYPRDKVIHALFEEKAAKVPEKAAIIYENLQFSYSELNEKANQLARVLRQKGVNADSIIGIMVERSPEMVIGIMGILKAGGAYLPIDPEYPPDRIAYILQDSRTGILLTQKKFRAKVSYQGEIIELDNSGIYEGECSNPEVLCKPDNLAYIIYTSGSTGKPKGVMVEHKSVVNTLFSLEREYPVETDDTYLLKTAYTFDVSVMELFGWFIGEGRLAILKQGQQRSHADIVNAIDKYGITHINFAPSMLHVFIDGLDTQHLNKLRSLKYVFSAGEALSADTVRKFRNVIKNAKLENIYGPTEATIYATKYKTENCHELLNIPIGQPLSNMKAYIIDKYGKLQPVGVPGELCLSGDGLARGYLFSAELTAEKFVENPFEPGKRLYKTGDLARWLQDGNIEFLGRMDYQVKIRGFRIETGEIAQQLLSYRSVKEAVVIAREAENKTKYLCAYMTAEKELEVSELRSHLSSILPDYMIPSFFVQLDKLPITSNGKIDRKALPEPGGKMKTGTDYAAPRNNLEEKLAKIFEEVLKVEQVGINDNFFDLGGHSLKALKVVNLIYKILNIRMSIQTFFECQTIENLANYIKNNGLTAFEEIEKLPAQPYYELSYPQKRLWIINQREPLSTAYNMTGKLFLNEKVNVKAVEKALQFLINRHESLRTSIYVVEGNPVQSIESAIDFTLPFTDLSLLPNEEKQIQSAEIYKGIAEQNYDLGRAPLFSCALLKLAEEQYEIIMGMHHIISDGWSMELIKNEFILAYEAFKNGKTVEIAPLEIQYKDFSAWQNKQIKNGEKMELARQYWLEQLEDEAPPLILSSKYQLGQAIDRTGAAYTANISIETKEKLKAISKESQATLFTILLSVLNIYLMDLTGTNNIAVGTAGSGREHESLEKVVGFFINTTILKNHVSRDERFYTLLERIRANTLKALEYQSYPIEKIIDELNIKYPEITIFFNMLNMTDGGSQTVQGNGHDDINEMKDMKFHITFYITEHEEGISVECAYIKSLFKPSRITQMLDRYIGLVNRIADNPREIVVDYLE